MASFCAQCSIDIWGHDDKDYAGQTTPEQTKQRVYALILCEGCGPTHADHRGYCVDPRCALQHGVLVEEAETGDLLEAKPFEYNDVPVEPTQEELDAMNAADEPVGKDWLEGLDAEPGGKPILWLQDNGTVCTLPDLTPEEKAKVENYLAEKWGLKNTDAVREQLRQTMSDNHPKTTEERDTYADGFGQGLGYAIRKIDTAGLG